MPDSPPRSRLSFRALADALVLGLIPLGAALITLLIGFRGRPDVSASTYVEGMPFLIAAVAFPSGLPIWVATGRRTKIAVVVAMTVVAVIAAIINVGSDDESAGLPFVWVVTLALPLAAVVALAQLARTVQPRQWGARRTED